MSSLYTPMGYRANKKIITTNFEEQVEDRVKLETIADGYLIKADVTPSM